MSEQARLLGQVVTVSAGRDQGHDYVVVGYAPPHFLLLADGRMRTVTNPKKKNIRHTKVSANTSREVTNKFACGDKVTDIDLRQALARKCLPDKL